MATKMLFLFFVWTLLGLVSAWETTEVPTTKLPVTTTTTTTSSPAATILGCELAQIVSTKNGSCFDYKITIGQGGLLNLERIIIGLPCVTLCTLLSNNLITLNIPLDITGTVLNLPLVVVGHIGLDASSGLCGIVVDVDLNPLIVNALDLITLNICLNLSLVINLGLLNGLLGSVVGTVEVLLGTVLSQFSASVPDLCQFIPL